MSGGKTFPFLLRRPCRSTIPPSARIGGGLSPLASSCLIIIVERMPPRLIPPIISLAPPRPPHFADTFLRRRDDANKEEEAAASDSELKPSILFQFTTYDRDQIALVTILTAISTAA